MVKGLTLSFLAYGFNGLNTQLTTQLSLTVLRSTWQLPIAFIIFYAYICIYIFTHFFIQVIHQVIYLTLFQILTTYYQVIIPCPLGFLYILNTSFPLKHFKKRKLKPSLYLLHQTSRKEIINVVGIIYKSVFFIGVMVTKFKVQNPPFILPSTQITTSEILAYHYYFDILTLSVITHQPFIYFLFPEALNFFYSHNIFLCVII